MSKDEDTIIETGLRVLARKSIREAIQELTKNAKKPPSPSEFMDKVEKEITPVVEGVISDELQNFMDEFISNSQEKE